MEEKYQIIKKIVEKILSGSAHDMDHIMRVYDLCLNLSEGQEIDLDVLKKSALLHDVARIKEDEDPSGKTNHTILGAEMAKNILTSIGYFSKIDLVQHCIITHRFRTGNEPKTIEAKTLFDADKLDALGAIGIARSFAIAGQHGERFYSDISLNQYIKENLDGRKSGGRIKEVSKHTPYFEFETKFKRIPEKLYTKKARKIAEKRLEFMELFFKKLELEIKGKM